MFLNSDDADAWAAAHTQADEEAPQGTSEGCDPRPGDRELGKCDTMLLEDRVQGYGLSRLRLRNLTTRRI